LLSIHFSWIVINLISNFNVMLRHHAIILNFQKLSRFSCLDFYCLDYPRIFEPIFLLSNESVKFSVLLFICSHVIVYCLMFFPYLLPRYLLIVSIISSLFPSSLCLVNYFLFLCCFPYSLFHLHIMKIIWIWSCTVIFIISRVDSNK